MAGARAEGYQLQTSVKRSKELCVTNKGCVSITVDNSYKQYHSRILDTLRNIQR